MIFYFKKFIEFSFCVKTKDMAEIDERFEFLSGTFLDCFLLNKPLSEIQKLLDKAKSEGYDIVNVQDGRGWSPLHYAVFKKNVEKVKFLLSEGANPNATTRDGLSPLHTAAFVSDSEILMMTLIDYGGNIYQKNHCGQTPMSSLSGSKMRKLEQYVKNLELLEVKCPEEDY